MAVRAAQQVKSAAPANAKAQPQQAPGAKQAAASPKATAQFNQSVAKNAPAQKPAAEAKLKASAPSNVTEKGGTAPSTPPTPTDVSNALTDSTNYGLHLSQQANKNPQLAPGQVAADEAKSRGDINTMLDSIGSKSDGTLFKMEDYYTSQLNPVLDKIGANASYRGLVNEELGRRTQQGLAGRIAADYRESAAYEASSWGQGGQHDTNVSNIRAESARDLAAEIKRNTKPVVSDSAGEIRAEEKNVRDRLSGDPQIKQAKTDIAKQYAGQPSVVNVADDDGLIVMKNTGG